MKLTEQVHELIRRHVLSGDVAVDATMGNGHDTQFLAEVVGATGSVYGFDVQAAAIEATRGLIGAHGVENVHLVQACHSELEGYLPAAAVGDVSVVVFNLGYLPGGDKELVTRPQTTVAAVEVAYRLLRAGGLISVLAYIGHAGGVEEADAVEAAMDELPNCEWVRRDVAVGGSTSPRLLVVRKG